jgi:sugar lactone lactonase YvrE
MVAIFTETMALAQLPPLRSGGQNGQVAWFLKGSYPDPQGFTATAPGGVVTVVSRPATPLKLDLPNPPPCRRAQSCGNVLPDAPKRGEMQRVQWAQMLGYRFTYPIDLPPGTGGVPAVALDSRNYLWVFQRKPTGRAQLFKYDPAHKLILTVGEDVIPHHNKAHGIAVDAEDNVWIVDTGLATVTKLSPDGKVLLRLGERGHRGDWDEGKGQRLLWEPVMVAFGKNGNVYIAEGHGNESPNDTQGDDPANQSGAARVIQLDRDGKFIRQWFGNNVGQGKFANAHAIGIDPTNGDVWIGDREDYRIQIYSADGKSLRQIPTRNLVCAIQFDHKGNPWMASGQDGQFLKLDQSGRVLGAVGNGMGIGQGEFIEASYWVFDKQDNLYAGDTSVGRVTVMVR